MASVRGIGVAVMISWWGTRPWRWPFSCSFRRCCTPKRCCSSTMKSARFLNSMPSWKGVRATTMRTARRRRSLRALAPAGARGLRTGQQRRRLVQRLEPVAQVAPVLLGEQLDGRHRRRLQAAARGGRAAAAATTVLPQPTSPCGRRPWACPREVGVGIAQRRATRVRKGSAASAARAAPRRWREAGSALSVRRRSGAGDAPGASGSRCCAGWRPVASSASCASRGGRCRYSSAAPSGGSRAGSGASLGMKSRSGARSSSRSASATSARSRPCGTPSVSG